MPQNIHPLIAIKWSKQKLHQLPKKNNSPKLSLPILTPSKVSMTICSTMNSQSPIIHNILRISKDELSINNKKYENWFGGKYYNYRSDNDNLLSLPCPAINCKCGIFSQVFDNYDVNVKKVLLKKHSNRDICNKKFNLSLQ